MEKDLSCEIVKPVFPIVYKRDTLSDQTRARLEAERDKWISRFRELVTSNTKVDRIKILQGWHQYAEIYSINHKLLYITGLEKLIENIIKCLQGYPFDERLAERGHLFFKLDTYQFGGKRSPGMLLEYLDRYKMFNALSFCETMDSVGWKTGDLSQKFPPT